MKSFTAALTLFAAAAFAVAAPTTNVDSTGMFKHAPGAADGLYSHHVGLDGTVHTQYHGAMNSTMRMQHLPALNATAPVTTSAMGMTPSKRGDTGVHCGSITFTASDAQNAIQGLAGTFGSHPQFFHSVSYVSGTATAFGCDYGHGQTMSGVEFTGYLNDVAHDCGNNKGGWYSIPDAKSSYGITTAGSGFC